MTTTVSNQIEKEIKERVSRMWPSEGLEQHRAITAMREGYVMAAQDLSEVLHYADRHIEQTASPESFAFWRELLKLKGIKLT